MLPFCKRRFSQFLPPLSWILTRLPAQAERMAVMRLSGTSLRPPSKDIAKMKTIMRISSACLCPPLKNKTEKR
jgi:hypothetical protein